MRGTVLYGPGDVRFEECPDPKIVEPTDAIIKVSATCVCGSDLWPYRGLQPITQPTPFGHEYCGVVEEVGRAVKSVKRGQFVIGSFFASDNTCPHCQAGYQSSCQHRVLVGGAQAPMLRVPLADGTLVATPESPSGDIIPSLLAVSDVMGTGWFAADAANVKPGKTVAVVGELQPGSCRVDRMEDSNAARHREVVAGQIGTAKGPARREDRQGCHGGTSLRRRVGPLFYGLLAGESVEPARSSSAGPTAPWRRRVLPLDAILP